MASIIPQTNNLKRIYFTKGFFRKKRFEGTIVFQEKGERSGDDLYTIKVDGQDDLVCLFGNEFSFI